MIKNTFKSILFFVLTLNAYFTIAQGELPSNSVFRLQNVETGKFLTDAGASATPVTMSDSGEAPNTHFKIIQSGAFYNIDSETFGIIRAVGTGSVVSTSKASPAADTDKTWSVSYNATDDTYRFQSRNSRFMYHEANGTVTHIAVSAADNRSNWKIIPFVQIPAEVAPDEDVSTDLSCPSSGEFRNDNTRNVDISNAVNVGTADDRSCYSDYSEVDLYGKTWGVYNITDGSNHWDAATLQPRIERSLPRSSETGVGSFARFSGIVRILEVGDGGTFSNSGSYLAQAKGKHSGEGGSRDPAICLYRAHPVMGTGINADKQVAFDIYAERILERGGEGNGREVVLLKRVNKNEEVEFVLEVGFRVDPNDPTKKEHYCDATIGGELFPYAIPEPERGLESGIRYGAYRVRGGRAQFRWANTTYQKAEVEEDIDRPVVSDDVFRLRNVATGQFLKDAGASATPVTMSDSGEASNTHWKFEESGDFINIDSQTFGILRATGSNFSAGAFAVVSTSKAPPAADSDKVWTLYKDEATGLYRFEHRNNARFLYVNEDNSVVAFAADATDERGQWEAIPTSQSLSVKDNLRDTVSLKVYPNPAKDNFTIALGDNSKGNVIIYNTLGKTIYNKALDNGGLIIKNNQIFTAGIYMIKVITSANKVYHSKLIIK